MNKTLYGFTCFKFVLNPEETGECVIGDFMSIVSQDARVKKFRDNLYDNYIDETPKFNRKIYRL